MAGAAPASCRPLLEDFWQAVFLYLYNPSLLPLAAQGLQQLAQAFPPLVERLGKGLAILCAQCADGLRTRGKALPPDFWRAKAPLLRLFSGHLHMFLQNANYSLAGWQTAVDRLTALCALFAARR